MHNHPAYGVITVSRPSSSPPGATLFGSDLQHQHYISVEVKTADLKRDLHKDWVHPTGSLIRFSLSEAQWGKFVSGTGRSQATPVTLERIREGHLVSVPMIRQPKQNRKDCFNQEFKAKLAESMEEINTKVSQLSALLDDKTISKTKLRGIAGSLKIITEQLPGNLNFIVESFKEVTEEMVAEAMEPQLAKWWSCHLFE